MAVKDRSSPAAQLPSAVISMGRLLFTFRRHHTLHEGKQDRNGR
jgi:hypothetical protein